MMRLKWIASLALVALVATSTLRAAEPLRVFIRGGVKTLLNIQKIFLEDGSVAMHGITPQTLSNVTE